MPKADENRVYSCAFDGYTNIRQEASSKAAAIGKLKNGPEGAEFLGLEGDGIYLKGEWNYMTKSEFKGLKKTF